MPYSIRKCYKIVNFYQGRYSLGDKISSGLSRQQAIETFVNLYFDCYRLLSIGLSFRLSVPQASSLKLKANPYHL